jgi:hypothetical protein
MVEIIRERGADQIELEVRQSLPLPPLLWWLRRTE